MRTKYDAQLLELNHEMITMGMLCESALNKASESLVTGNIAKAKELPDMLADINEKEREIESFCMRLVMQQQPVATDLRYISSAQKMVSDMERIGDQATDIADIVLLGNIHKQADLKSFQDMAVAVTDMVHKSIDAFVKVDEEAARAVIAYDDVVDRYFDKMKEQLVEELNSKGADAESALDQLMIAKYFERSGDHAENIAKWVIFSITGTKPE